jgi:hypothetical protein
VPCGNGLTTNYPGQKGGKLVASHSKIWIGSHGGNPVCRLIDVITVAHELGHVLGLDHENHACAVMNPASMSLTTDQGPWSVAPERCRGLKEGSWFCRVLSKDDLKGAKKLYGGHPRVRGKEFCPTGSGSGRRVLQRSFDFGTITHDLGVITAPATEDSSR